MRELRLWREGELGRIFTAVDKDGRPCTVRVVDGPPPPEWETLRRSRSESCLEQVWAWGATPGSWVVCDGWPVETLADRLQRDGPLPDDDADRLGRDIRFALFVLHRILGITHGGVCPSTIVRVGDRWRLTAVALAPLLCDYRKVTPVTAYAADELLDGGAPSQEGDEFALGLTLEEAVRGEAVVPWHEGEDASDLRRRRPGYAHALAAAAERFGRIRLGRAAMGDDSFDDEPPDVQKPRPRIGTPPQPSSVADHDVQFTVYRPGRVQPGTWYTMLAFAHKTDEVDDPVEGRIDPVEQMRQQAAAILGPKLGLYATAAADSKVELPRGSDLLFVPTVEGIEFNPPQRSFAWEEPVHHETFRLRAADHLVGTRARGALHVFLGAVIIADVSLSIAIDPTAAEDGQEPVETDRARRYDRIFVSYSHKDVAVVERVKVGATALGHEVVLDRTHLRSGQEFGPELERLIAGADVFQLFWSRNSMASSYVRDEWTYALSLSRPSFIRPVYWEDPFPEGPGLPPEQLRRLHFFRLSAPAAEEERRGTIRAQPTQPPGPRPQRPLDPADGPPWQVEHGRPGHVPPLRTPRVPPPPRPPAPQAPVPPPPSSAPSHPPRRRRRGAVLLQATAALAAVLAFFGITAVGLDRGDDPDITATTQPPPATTTTTTTAPPGVRVVAITAEPPEVCRVTGRATVRVVVAVDQPVSAVRIRTASTTTAITMTREAASAVGGRQTYRAVIGDLAQVGPALLEVEVVRRDSTVLRQEDATALTVVECVR
ncbi:MAG TPA: TIR domain-containing protein [Acidimicrobiales bacterium]